LRYAAANGHLEVVQYLVEKGANIHADDDRAIRLAAANYFIEVEMIKCLVEGGANIHAGDDDAVRTAAARGNLEVVRYLVANGANMRAKHDDALRCCVDSDVLRYLFYEVCYGETNDFEFKYNLVKEIKFTNMGVCTMPITEFKEEYDRRKEIQSDLAEILVACSMKVHLRPSSLRVAWIGAYFGQDFSDRQYWE